MAIETVTIRTFTKDLNTGIVSASSTKVTGQTFMATIGNLERKFIINKCLSKSRYYVLTDVKTGLRADYLYVTNKKFATVEKGKETLDKLIQKHGLDRVIQTLHNADLQAGLEPQQAPF
ncbi:hypothetical protein [Marinomonas transparens]|uniref:Uncharacterized protein n=1 Tax=Marinomonas transparens TaxID=2795388 RepID=A0A934MVG2_9GAMM|nr:hypothetical protein [Marinomonas transparens]MBJ7536994.1 hypothetical protein [Marinomonas transparens]